MSETIQQVQQAFTTYTIERELGAGGMATVYLARDKKHDRKVAIKILHAELAAVLGGERFLQEIRVTASLQHPHILGLIDSGIVAEGELQGRPYYVMPFIRGESLRDRLNKEQQLPVSDAVRIATEVASALDYAHRERVVHRDIKPENILLHDGSAIVADFGIALAVTQAGGARMTQTGLSLGTPSYMSPEQAMGERTITARSDIYSLGAVTYEMLSGEPPFTGPTVQAIVARVMTEEPRPLTAQRRSLPPHVAAAVAHALEKVPADRFATAHEFADALNNPSFTLAPKSGVLAAKTVNNRERRLMYGAAGFAALFLITTLWGWMRPAPSKPVVRYNLALDSAEAMAPGASWWSRLAISPDGSRLAYVDGAHGQILIRPRDQLHATPIQGSAGAETPFFSPDGERIGALAEQRVYIAAIDGGQAITVSDTLTGVAGASWARDGFIYVDGQGPSALLRVEAKARAVPKWFTVLDSATGEVDHTWPDVLPNGKGVLFTVAFAGKNAVKAGTTYAIAVAEIPSGKHRVIVNDAKFARYAASGHLLYVTTNKTLMVVPFDQNSMQIVGTPRPLVEGMRLGDLGAADLAVSETGTLVYATGAGEGKHELVWVTRAGKPEPVDANWQATFGSPALSPDGKKLAVSINTSTGRADIWTKQLDGGPAVNLTLDGKGNFNPTWTPDGRSLTFQSAAGGTGSDLRTKRADGSANAALQFNTKRDLFQPLWSPDGKWLIFVDVLERGTIGIFGVRPGIDAAPVPLVASKIIQVSPTLSGDGRWLAYDSNESGIPEVYVVPFPNTGAAKWAVGGGTEPRWSHSGKELFYRDASGRLIAVEINTNPTFSLGRSTPLFSAAEFQSDQFVPQYDVSLDDRRFLMIRSIAANAPDKLIVVDNWFEELKAKSRK
jgi:dipeptidyl aminopeptidase/acylaminoacyl peptidase/tRNA A-37 threonylcarbamoyl transferase component Bud32